MWAAEYGVEWRHLTRAGPTCAFSVAVHNTCRGEERKPNRAVAQCAGGLGPRGLSRSSWGRQFVSSEYAGVELNTKGRYAVMAMADIAKHALLAKHGAEPGPRPLDSAEAIPLSQIAERQNISLAYLEQLFLRLRRAGLVESARGRAGGYRLGRAANEISDD